MSAFDPNDDLSQDVAFRLLLNTPVTLFWRQRVLDETLDRLMEGGYQVAAMDASAWTSDSDFHESIARALSFPTTTGGTWTP